MRRTQPCADPTPPPGLPAGSSLPPRPAPESWTGVFRHRTGGGLPDAAYTSDNYRQDRHLGDFLRVDFPQQVLSPLRA